MPSSLWGGPQLWAPPVSWVVGILQKEARYCSSRCNEHVAVLWAESVCARSSEPWSRVPGGGAFGRGSAEDEGGAPAEGSLSF